MAITTGMREGELLSLHWEDIDFEKKVVFVHRTVTRIIGQGYQETEPKTKASRRRIVLHLMLCESIVRANKSGVYRPVISGVNSVWSSLTDMAGIFISGNY